MNLAIISSILSSIGIIVGNPALGVLPDKLAPLLSLVSGLVAQGEEAMSKLNALDVQLKMIISQERPPTVEEWAEWNERHQSAKEAIANA